MRRSGHSLSALSSVCEYNNTPADQLPAVGLSSTLADMADGVHMEETKCEWLGCALTSPLQVTLYLNESARAGLFLAT